MDRARILRLLALAARSFTNRLELAAAMAEAAEATRKFNEAMAEAEKREIYDHPDLLEVVVASKSWYPEGA